MELEIDVSDKFTEDELNEHEYNPCAGCYR